MKKNLLPFAVLLLVFIAQVDAGAQCAMCRATAESATENVDSGYGTGLNAAITYMIGIPYALLMLAILVFWRKKIVAFFRH